MSENKRDLKHAKKLCSVLRTNGFEAFFTGGYCRDFLLGLKPDDIDIATNATPEQVKEVFKDGFHIVPLGEKFGTVQVDGIEITTYRTETKYSDRRHPDSVKFETSLLKDLERRDFTINAIAMDDEGNVVDPFHGKNDLDNHVVRAVGNPRKRFDEDPLRMLRMCRFAGKLNFVVEKKTFKSAMRMHNLIDKIPKERVRVELLKILSIPDPTWALSMMVETELMCHILPELARLEYVPQPSRNHRFNVMHHMLETVKFIPEENVLLRFAGLIHDIGKKRVSPDPPPYFPDHHHVSEEIESIMSRLKFSSEDTEYVKFLVYHHMDLYNYTETEGDKPIRRFLAKVGEKVNFIPDLVALTHADLDGSGIPNEKFHDEIKAVIGRIMKVMSEKQPFNRLDLEVTGTDLMDIGIPPSDTIGKILDLLLSLVVESPEMNKKESLVNMAKYYWNLVKVNGTEILDDLRKGL